MWEYHWRRKLRGNGGICNHCVNNFKLQRKLQVFPRILFESVNKNNQFYVAMFITLVKTPFFAVVIRKVKSSFLELQKRL